MFVNIYILRFPILPSKFSGVPSAYPLVPLGTTPPLKDYIIISWVCKLIPIFSPLFVPRLVTSSLFRSVVFTRLIKESKQTKMYGKRTFQRKSQHKKMSPTKDSFL